MLWKYINNCIGKHADTIYSCVKEEQREIAMKYMYIYYKWKEKRIAEVSTWSTLAHVVWSPFGYIANSVILTGMRLAETVIRELSVNSQRGYFTEASGESPGTVAGIVSQPVHAPTTIQAGVRLTVVQVQRTILPRVARCTLATEMFKEKFQLLITVPFSTLIGFIS